MEILGIGPGEFILILILLLVVVGPERLPDLARQAGKLLVRGRNWIQSSPDAAMVMRARKEIEAELANLKTSLLEVQNVRNEVLDAAKQIGDSVNSLASATKAELEEIGNIAPPAPINPLAEMESALFSVHGEPLATNVTAAAETATEQLGDEPSDAFRSNLVSPQGEPIGSDRLAPHADRAPATLGEPRASQVEPPAEPAAGNMVASIDLRLQAIMSDMFALQEQLKQRGVLDASWRPPSWNIYMPEERPAGDASLPGEPALPAQPVEQVETEEAF